MECLRSPSTRSDQRLADLERAVRNRHQHALHLPRRPASITETGELAAGPADRINADGTVTRRNQGRKDNKVNVWDLRLSKDFHVGDWTLQPILDVFNVLDAENFLRPQVTALAFNFDGTLRTGAGDPREIQLGLRIIK